MALGEPGYSSQDTYYVVAHGPYVLSLVTACGVFAIVYLALRPSTTLQRRLGWVHVAAMAVGFALLLSPVIGFDFLGMPRRYVAPDQAFEAWRRMAQAGYVVSLLSLAPFAGLLLLKLVRGLRGAGPRSG
jgi:heme/copper-type cytochrome/quinol oxidase subunit 1